MRLCPDPSLQRSIETPVLRGDNAKLRAATGWAPEHLLETTLLDVLTEQRARFDVALDATGPGPDAS